MAVSRAGGRLVVDDDDGSKRFGFALILNGIGSKDFGLGLEARVMIGFSTCFSVVLSTGGSSFFSSFAAAAALFDLGDLFFLRIGRSRGLGGAGVPHTTVRIAFRANIGAGVCGGWTSSPEVSTQLVRISCLLGNHKSSGINHLPLRKTCL